MDREATEINGNRIRKEVLVTEPVTDSAENVYGSTAGQQQVMTGTSKILCRWSEHSTRWIAIARFEFIECSLQAIEVRGIAGMNDVEIERCNRGTTDYRRHTADHDQLDIVSGEYFKCVFESRWAVHGATR